MQFSSFCPGCLFALILFLFLLPFSKANVYFSFFLLAIPRSPSIVVFFFVHVILAFLYPPSDARLCFLYEIFAQASRGVSSKFFSLFFRFNCLCSPSHIWLPSVASRGRETKSKWTYCRMLLVMFCQWSACKLFVVLTNLHVAFLMTNAVFSLPLFALRFELSPTGAPSLLNSNRSRSIQKEGQPDSIVLYAQLVQTHI